MPNRKTKPTSPGRRFATYPLREQLTESTPERKLTEGLRKSGGRNANGRVTARHRGGGAKRRCAAAKGSLRCRAIFSTSRSTSACVAWMASRSAMRPSSKDAFTSR